MMNITESDYRRVASLLGVETAVVKAIAEVESGGKGGFLSDGRPVILFE
ncbi:MAG: N-acetylmuramidase family protein, partial [Odoribacter sp.]|nr:N-acetylmuramidase family protein [Odoribacter sp.]